MPKPIDLTSTNFGTESPAVATVMVTPDDNADLEFNSDVRPARALYIGTEGDITIMDMSDNQTTFVAVKGFFPVMVKRVYDTNTTASNIVALY